MTRLSYLLLLLLPYLFGTTTQAAEATVGADGTVEIDQELLTLSASLIGKNPALEEQNALDIANLLAEVKKDKATQEMLERMVQDNPSEFAAISQMKPDELVQQLAKAFEELKMLEVVFKDPARAVRLMEEEGMIPADSVDKYKADPTLLEADTRKGVYFQFATIANAAGLL